MRIVIATPLYPPEIGGPATYTKLLEAGLPERGIEVDVVKFGAVKHLPKIIRHYVYYRQVRAAARHADLVLALDPVSTGLPALKAAQKEGKPFVVKVVGDYAWEQGRQRFGITAELDDFVRATHVPWQVRLLRRTQTQVVRNAVRVIVPSQYLKHIVVAWGIAPQQIEVIYNAITPEELGVVSVAVEALAHPRVVTAGRLVPWKNMEGVIDAVANIARASLVIIGDGPLRTALEAYAQKKLQNRVCFTGVVSHAEVLATIRAADVFVLNSSYEGLSHQLIEVLALGVPSIATRVGGNPEVVTDGVEGLLIPAGDTPALTQALERVLGDEKLRAVCATNARESAKRFSVDTMLDALASVFPTLL